MAEERRSSEEIRLSLEETRSRLSADLDALGDRLRDELNPKAILSRYPVWVLGAGALAGFILLRKPLFIVRMATRLVGLSAPILVPIALRKIMGDDHEAPPYRGTP